ncbi:MAG: hypothetical protein ACJ75H_03755 [Thermoanaerobaculia bacterium]
MKAKVFRSVCVVLCLLVLGSVLTLSPARAEEGPREGRCLPLQKDLTNPAIAAFLSQQMLFPAGPQQAILLSSGQKVSRQSFAVGNGLGKMAAVTITCTSTCTGNGCSINGCDASSFGCSSCSCWGIGCSACTCSKTSTYTEPR